MKRFLLIAGGLLLLLVSLSVVGRMAATTTNNISTTSDEREGARVVNEAATENRRTPVVVELFTSEGCSSCPPADAVLARLDKTQPVKGAEIIVLSQHVDYWNRLGWADPFSSPAFSARQGDYAQAFGKDGVYTPQMIVDGQTEFPGGNENKARDAIAKAAQTRKASIQLTVLAQEPEEKKTGVMRLRINVENLPAVKAGDTAEVLLAVTESDLSVSVERGENAGQRLSHVGVVRSLRVIGGVDGKAGGTFTADTVIEPGKGMRREKLRAVVFVQERGSRRVLGAATARLSG